MYPGRPEIIQFFIDSSIKLMYLGSNTAAAVNEAVGSYAEVERQEGLN